MGEKRNAFIISRCRRSSYRTPKIVFISSPTFGSTETTVKYVKLTLFRLLRLKFFIFFSSFFFEIYESVNSPAEVILFAGLDRCAVFFLQLRLFSFSFLFLSFYSSLHCFIVTGCSSDIARDRRVVLLPFREVCARVYKMDYAGPEGRVEGVLLVSALAQLKVTHVSILYRPAGPMLACLLL